jgi:hypothetical protein
VKQRKIAISLAVVGAITAPFVFGTYKERPITHDPPLTAKEKADIAAELKETNNCQTFRDQSYLDKYIQAMPSVDPDRFKGLQDYAVRFCEERQRQLEAATWIITPDTLKYLGINAAIAASVFAAIFGLTYLLPALARRYWQWLKT